MNDGSITMTTSAGTTTVPGYVAGTWDIDPVHSEVGFAVRHMMVSKVRGKFKTFSGQIVTGENPLESSSSIPDVLRKACRLRRRRCGIGAEVAGISPS